MLFANKSAWYLEFCGLNLGIFAMHCVNVVCTKKTMFKMVKCVENLRKFKIGL